MIPAYNAARYLERALRSVFEQSLPPDEIIVVDDGSTDGTPELLARFADRLRVLRQANAGPAAARNRGIEAAKGELICFQDADDEWLPEKLAKQVALLEARPETDVCITRIRNVWSDPADEARERLANHSYANDPAGYVFQASLMRSRIFAKVGLLNEQCRRAEDIEWFARVRDAGIEVAVVSEVLVYRHLHGQNISAVNEATASDRYDELLEIMAARLRASGGKNEP